MDFEKRLNEIEQRASEAKSRDEIWLAWFDLVELELLIDRADEKEGLVWDEASKKHFKKVKSYE